MDRNRFAVNCSILFTEVALLERPAAAAAAGFSAVEFWWPFAVADPGHHEVDAFVAAVRSAGVTLTGLNFFAGDMPGGDRGILSHPDRGEEFAAGLEAIRVIADELECRLFNVLYGNRLDGVAPETQDTVALERLGALGEFTEATGSILVLEPLSGVDAYPLRHGRDALDVIVDLRATGADTAVKVLADLYHLTVNGDDAVTAVAELGESIGHVQIADVPGRGEPGSGSQPIDSWLEALDHASYQGKVGLEYVPSVPSAESFGWLD